MKGKGTLKSYTEERLKQLNSLGEKMNATKYIKIAAQSILLFKYTPFA